MRIPSIAAVAAALIFFCLRQAPACEPDEFSRLSAAEVLMPAFDAPGGQTTVNAYTGFVEVIVRGAGSDGPLFTDAFYGSPDDPTFSSPGLNGNSLRMGFETQVGTTPGGFPFAPNSSLNLEAGSLHVADLAVAYDGDSFAVDQTSPLNLFDGLAPVFDSAHEYRFVLDLGGYNGTLTFGLGDGGFDNNAGSFEITVWQVARETPFELTDFRRVSTAETLTPAFDVPGGQTTSSSYTGFVEVAVSGSGADGAFFTDAFYRSLNDPDFASPGLNDNSLRMGFETQIGTTPGGFSFLPNSSLHVEAGSLHAADLAVAYAGDSFPVDRRSGLDLFCGFAPVFDPSHQYHFVVDVGSYSGALTFGLGDGGVDDNAGVFDITLWQVDIDTDGDGIFDGVDTQPGVPSSDFSDGTTLGSILDPGDQTLAVTDHADGALGVVVEVVASAGSVPASVEACSGASVLSLDAAGDQAVVTCGSVTVAVVGGTIEITFVADDGTVASASLEAGNALTFQPETLTFSAPASNPGAVTVAIGGVEIPVTPGGSATLLPFVRADADADGAMTFRDVVTIVGYLLSSRHAPPALCLEALDVNDSGAVSFSDPVHLVAFLLFGKNEIPAPFPECGPDPTPDDLGCERFPPCEV